MVFGAGEGPRPFDPSPARGDRSRGCGFGDPQTAKRVGADPVPDPRANPFRNSRIHLPTSAYIVPSTAVHLGTDAVMKCGRA
ncbi:hypothetical protein RHMOL_RhmolUnG0008300 [Rhododendron molle]|nr:hypothetical protein RHMOL_RhmolUnG0008300 [Rhododendron molle]